VPGTERNAVFQLEGTYNGLLVQLPDRFGADPELKRVIMGIVQMSFKHSQAWGIGRLCGETLPGFGHPLSEEMLPNAQPEPRRRSLEPFPRVLSPDPGEICTALPCSWHAGEGAERASCRRVRRARQARCGSWCADVPALRRGTSAGVSGQRFKRALQQT